MFPTGTYHSEQRKRGRPTASFQCFAKRGFDIAVSATGLFILSPIILLISLAILIESSWPVLCRCKRYNSVNAEFHIFQFRITVAEWQEKTLNGSLDEMQRMTRFGRILHRSGIDKIPLLMSVLRGEMSIVGSHLFTNAPGKPIPPLDLGDVKPGLIAWTHPHDDRGLADTDKSIYHRIKCDRHYVNNNSLFLTSK